MRSEIRKFTSVRSFWVYVTLLFVLLVLPITLLSLLPADNRDASWEMSISGGPFFMVLAIVFMAAAIGGEIETRMYAHAFLTQNNRSLWLIARILVGLTTLAIIFTVGVAFILLILVALGMNLDLTNTAPLYTQIGLCILFPIFSACIAAMTGSKMLTSTIVIIWSFMLNQVLEFAATSSDKLIFLWLASPGTRMEQLGLQLSSVYTGGGEGWGVSYLQPLGFNLLVIVVWLVVFIAGAFVVNARRDVR
ncbi:MAG: hypothetical protein Q4A82_03325 [Corynebacterium sp.]|nr:hypothetical protein [Corynebacterium sp.]